MHVSILVLDLQEVRVRLVIAVVVVVGEVIVRAVAADTNCGDGYSGGCVVARSCLLLGLKL